MMGMKKTKDKGGRWFSPCCGNASAILTLDAAPKKGDHIYTPTVRTRRRISCRPRNYASSTERGSRKKITSGETRGESADRIVDGGWNEDATRVASKLPSPGSIVRRYRDLPRGIRGSKRIISRCRTETYTVPIVGGNLRRPRCPLPPPFVRSSLSGPFPRGSRCVLVANWRRELAPVNNAMLVNRDEIP